MSKLVPKYSLWEAINAATLVGIKALEEIRLLARIPGPPGKDGISADQISMEYDGERTVTFKYAGETRGSFKMPIVIDRGVWKETGYEAGDGVTWGGSFWIAQQATSDKPDSGKGWRLAVKRGRDGKDGEVKPARDPKPVKVG